MVQGHVWLDSVGAAAGEKVVVEGDALSVGLAHAAIGKDAAPGDRHADAVHAKALAQLEVAIVAVIEVAGGLGRKAALLGEVVVPCDLALAMGLASAFYLVGSGGATKNKVVRKALGGIGGKDGAHGKSNLV